MNQRYINAKNRITDTTPANLKMLEDLMIRILAAPNQQIAIANELTDDQAKLDESLCLGMLWGVDFVSCHMDKENRRVFTINEFGHRFISEIEREGA